MKFDCKFIKVCLMLRILVLEFYMSWEEMRKRSLYKRRMQFRIKNNGIYILQHTNSNNNNQQ